MLISLLVFFFVFVVAKPVLPKTFSPVYLLDIFSYDVCKCHRLSYSVTFLSTSTLENLYYVTQTNFKSVNKILVLQMLTLF